MFDLEREIAAWSAAVNAERCRTAEANAELTDHLHCEIERARTEGLSVEEAFRVATERIGSTSQLTSEYAKNRSAIGEVCQVAAKIDRSRPEHRPLLLAHAVLWAVVMLATAMLLKRSSLPQLSTWLLTGIFIPLWWASDQLMQRVLRGSVSGS